MQHNSLQRQKQKMCQFCIYSGVLNAALTLSGRLLVVLPSEPIADEAEKKTSNELSK